MREDDEIEHAKPLPDLEAVSLPAGLCNESFGDLAMVVEFLHVFQQVLAPQATAPIASAGRCLDLRGVGGPPFRGRGVHAPLLRGARPHMCRMAGACHFTVIMCMLNLGRHFFGGEGGAHVPRILHSAGH